MNLPELYAAVNTHLTGWTPTFIVRDNTPAQTSTIRDYIRLTIDGGEGVITRRTGMLSNRGNYIRHPVFIRFAVHVPMNGGEVRAATVCQQIRDHWHYAQIDPFLTLDAISTSRVGEIKPHYRMNVDISGFRDERV